jgi:hypothetical protein
VEDEGGWESVDGVHMRHFEDSGVSDGRRFRRVFQGASDNDSDNSGEDERNEIDTESEDDGQEEGSDDDEEDEDRRPHRQHNRSNHFHDDGVVVLQTSSQFFDGNLSQFITRRSASDDSDGGLHLFDGEPGHRIRQIIVPPQLRGDMHRNSNSESSVADYYMPPSHPLLVPNSEGVLPINRRISSSHSNDETEYR